ncbi:MAG: DUF6600 domain-containing protein [Terriglobales bacterium]
MRTMIRAVSLLLFLLGGLVFAPWAMADSQVRIVRLSLVDGPVQVDRGGGEGFQKAIMNMPITQGMKLSTQDEGRAEVEFEDGTTMRLAPQTDVEFSSLGLRSSGARLTTVQVNQGTTYFNVRHKGDDDFRVAFANREISLDHNVHFRLDLTTGNPELAVFGGEVELKGDKEHVKIKKNETLTLDVGDAGRYDLAKNITAESYDSWDSDRLNYSSQYASSSYNSRSPYSYGVSDLNYYGSWYSAPGYGMLWQPYGVGYGWDPFYNGAWAWYPGFGYTWVSTYPWGWTPYRYGSWLFVPNFGWAWRPGVWNTWYTVPPVYNAPVYYHGPRPPNPVTVMGGSSAVPHPTVVVNNGTRDPRIVPPVNGFFGGKNMNSTVGGTAPISPLAGTVATPPRTTVPVSGTGIAAPGSPIPIHGRHSEMRMDRIERDASPAFRPAPGPHMEHRASPIQHSAPAPIQRSAPAVRSAPTAPSSGGGHSSGGGGHASSSGSGRSQR